MDVAVTDEIVLRGGRQMRSISFMPSDELARAVTLQRRMEMTLPEASRCFQISIEELQFYEKNGLLKGRKTKDGGKDYLEADLQYIGKFHFLQTAGMNADSLKQFVRLSKRGPDTRDEQIRLLRKFRFGLFGGDPWKTAGAGSGGLFAP